MKLLPLALTALTALTTLAATPKAEAAPRMTSSNKAQMQRCTNLANEHIEWEEERWMANRVGPQPRRYENVVVIPAAMVTELSTTGHIRLACGMVKTHWNSNKKVYTQIAEQLGADGDYWNRIVWNPKASAVAAHNSYTADYNASVRLYNAETAAWNAANADPRTPYEISRCRDIYGTGLNMVTVDWCTGESW